MLRSLIAITMTVLLKFPLLAQLPPAIPEPLRISLNVPYTKDKNGPQKLDIYSQRDGKTPRPTVIWFHGAREFKEASVLFLVPYLEMGWNVVNVEYSMRPLLRPMAPTATGDGLCALRWVVENSDEYGLDKNRIVLAGESAGGTLALTTGMISNWPGLDARCPLNEKVKIAAIVNWYGVFDLLDVLDGPNKKSYAIEWFDVGDPRDVAIMVSPRTYVGPSNPPIISIHGDADPAVPYDHSVKLHEALSRAGVTQSLLTIPGGKHGEFTKDQNRAAYDAIRNFLRARGLVWIGGK